MEEEKYNLSDLLLFFKGQNGCNYAIIERILNIINDENLSFEAKESLIKDHLRANGLYEIGYSEEPEPQLQKQPVPVHQVYPNKTKAPFAELLVLILTGPDLLKISLN